MPAKRHACAAIVVLFALAASAAHGTPLALSLSAAFGWYAHGGGAGGARVCVNTPAEECRTGRESEQAGGFGFLSGVAIDRDPGSPNYGDIYVADLTNDRLQVFTPDYAFLLMFGWGVNATNSRRHGAGRSEMNLCTGAEIRSAGVRCEAGSIGRADAGALDDPTSVAVDSRSGAVYVEEAGVEDFRVEKYTPSGNFVWMLGRGVNGRTGGNRCSALEVEHVHAHCRRGRAALPGSREHAAFNFSTIHGAVLAVGGPLDLVYCGDEHRVQEFTSDGRWAGEISLSAISSRKESHVTAITVDELGDVYLVYRSNDGKLPEDRAPDVIRELDPGGKQVMAFRINPRVAGNTVKVEGLSYDSGGRLAVIALELSQTGFARMGAVYDSTSGQLIDEFAFTSDNDGGSAFGANGQLYVAATDEHQVLVFSPTPTAELMSSLIPCEAPGESHSAIVFGCGIDARRSSQASA